MSAELRGERFGGLPGDGVDLADDSTEDGRYAGWSILLRTRKEKVSVYGLDNQSNQRACLKPYHHILD